MLPFAGYCVELVQSVVVEGDGLSASGTVFEFWPKLLYVWIRRRQLRAGDATLKCGVDWQCLHGCDARTLSDGEEVRAAIMFGLYLIILCVLSLFWLLFICSFASFLALLRRR